MYVCVRNKNSVTVGVRDFSKRTHYNREHILVKEHMLVRMGVGVREFVCALREIEKLRACLYAYTSLREHILEREHILIRENS